MGLSAVRGRGSSLGLAEAIAVGTWLRGTSATPVHIRGPQGGAVATVRARPVPQAGGGQAAAVGFDHRSAAPSEGGAARSSFEYRRLSSRAEYVTGRRSLSWTVTTIPSGDASSPSTQTYWKCPLAAL